MWRLFSRAIAPQNGNSQYRFVTTTYSNKKDNVESCDDNLSSISDDPDSFGTHVDNLESSKNDNFQQHKLEDPKIINKFLKSKNVNSCNSNISEKNITYNFIVDNKVKKNRLQNDSNFKSFYATLSNVTEETEKVFGNTLKKKEKERNIPNKLHGEQKNKAKSNSESVSNVSDQFGNLSVTSDKYESYVGDETEGVQEKYEDARSQPREEDYLYSRKIKKLCISGKLREAVHVLEVEMHEAGVLPEVYAYRLLIGECAKKGYSKKAFSLYKRLKSQGLKAQPQIYTMLFVACGNDYTPDDGLRRINKLREEVHTKGVPLNDRHYHAIIRAYGRCGDVEKAFEVFDEMISEKRPLSTESFNFLLQACVSDKEAGFRHALVVWRKMRHMNRRPDIYAYNLLLTCTLSCGAGDPQLLSQILEESTAPWQPPVIRTKESNNKRLSAGAVKSNETRRLTSFSGDPTQHESESDVKRIVVGRKNIDDDDIEISTEYLVKKGSQTDPEKSSNTSEYEEIPRDRLFESSHLDDGECEVIVTSPDSIVVKQKEPEGVLPCLLAENPSMGAVVALTSLDKPQDRLAVLGGSAGLLAQMEADSVDANLKTYTQLVRTLPDSLHAEEALLRSMARNGVTPDITFCNMLIKKRVQRQDYEQAKATLELLAEHRLHPNVMTYGCLALGCRTLIAATEFLKDMDDSGNRPNIEIMTTLTMNALSVGHYFFVLNMLQKLHHYQLQPNECLIKKLEIGRERALQNIRRVEKQGTLSSKDRDYLTHNRVFLLEYKQYLKGNKIQRQEPPWAYFDAPLTGEEARSS